MKQIKYTLLADGNSDQRLMPHLTWLLHKHLPEFAVQETWSEVRRFIKPPRTLADKIARTIEYYPCDLLFVHRDAEGETREEREREIETALEKARKPTRNSPSPPVVCVIPVRMQEAWLLFDEKALRRAVDKPEGKKSLTFPKLHEIEGKSDPKEILNTLLREASEASGRRLKSLDVVARGYRLASLIEDFSPLLALPAFRALELALIKVIDEQGWK